MCVCQPGKPKLKAVKIIPVKIIPNNVWERDDPPTLWLTAVFVPVHLLAHTRPLVHSQQNENTSHGNTSSFSVTVLVNGNKRLWHVCAREKGSSLKSG